MVFSIKKIDTVAETAREIYMDPLKKQEYQKKIIDEEPHIGEEGPVPLRSVNKFIVKRDTYKTGVTTLSADEQVLFGDINQGVIIQAETPEQAIMRFAARTNENPYYLRAFPISEAIQDQLPRKEEWQEGDKVTVITDINHPKSGIIAGDPTTNTPWVKIRPDGQPEYRVIFGIGVNADPPQYVPWSFLVTRLPFRESVENNLSKSIKNISTKEDAEKELEKLGINWDKKITHPVSILYIKDKKDVAVWFQENGILLIF